MTQTATVATGKRNEKLIMHLQHVMNKAHKPSYNYRKPQCLNYNSQKTAYNRRFIFELQYTTQRR